MLKVNQLSKIYQNGYKALNNINFEMEYKDILGVIGPNGAGKTTLLNILSNLLEPTNGSISIDGIEVNDISRDVGFVLEEVCFYEEMTGYENLKFIGELFQVKNINNTINKLIEIVKLEDVINNKVKLFSAGMKKRLSIARALIHNPSILIFDEPTNTLDIENKEIIFNIFKQLKGKNKIIIISSHNLDEIYTTCNKYLIINKEQKFFGEKSELLENIKNKKVRIQLLEKINTVKLKTILPSNFIYLGGKEIEVAVSDINCISDIITNLVSIGAKILFVELKNDVLKDIYLNKIGCDCVEKAL